MQSNSMVDFALNLIERNPGLRNNPNAREMIEVIRSGDASRGQQIAENLCRTYGVEKDRAVDAARSFFHI